MAITQVNPTDFNYADLSDAQTQTYKGKADITISEYDTDSAPDVKVGSVFENNGTLFIVDTADITPTGYSGISNSTTFYLYYDEPAGAFIFSSTVPVWSDTLQGWYNGNDRAFFSMYKDSGGTLYGSKKILNTSIAVEYSGGIQTDNIILKTKVIEIGDWNMDITRQLDVAHGLTQVKIRDVRILIRQDAPATNTQTWDSVDMEFTSYKQYTQVLVSDIRMYQGINSIFDSSIYDDTGYNRGWIIITYEA